VSSRAVLVSAISAAAFFPSGMLLAWSIDDRLYHRAGAEISLLYSAALAIIGFIGFVMARWFAERSD
jgi:hypothetical protein